jgi:serpin B
MKKVFIMIMFVLLFSLTGCGKKYQKAMLFEAPKVEKTSTKIAGSKFSNLEIDDAYKEAIINFSYNTAAKLLSENNVMYSPISLFFALSQLGEITSGSTRQEILQALQVESIDTLRIGNQNLYQKISYINSNSLLQIGNSIWLKNNELYKEEPLKILAEKYYASSFNVDFSDELTKEMLEAWVSDNTGGHLGKDAFKDLDPLTTFILLNTIYFYDQWKDKFNAKDNIVGNFKGVGNVTYMRKALNSYYLDGPDYEASSLAFNNGMSIIFVLPKENVNFSDFISNPAKLSMALKTKTYQPFEVYYQIPKFSYKSSLNLFKFTQDLGIKEAFVNGDFSSLTEEPLVLSSILQKTFIEIDEEGGRAAAVTEISGVKNTAPGEPVNFILNRPFIYAITSFDYPIFIGVVKNPNDHGEYQYQ